MRKIIIVFIFFSFSNLYSQNWTLQSNPSIYELEDIQFINENIGWAVGRAYILTTSNGGINWNTHSYISGSYYFFISILDSNNIIIGKNQYVPTSIYPFGYNSIQTIKTTTSGISWETSYFGTITFQNGIIKPKFINKDTIWAILKLPLNNSCHIYNTINSGTNWYHYSSNTGIVWNDIEVINNSTFFIGGTVLRKTTSYGLVWTQVDTTLVTALSFPTSKTGYMVSRGKVFKSTNYGDNWFQSTPLNDTLQNYRNDIFFADSLNGTVVGNFGVIERTTNGGLSWYLQTSSTLKNLYKTFFINKNTGWAVGRDGTILKTTNGGGSVNIEPINEVIPYQFSLSQNYPNPFNPVTNIKFQIPKSSFVNLKIYDLTGREVETLVSENLNIGEYQVQWNASNFTSGVYFYKLQAENFTQTKKMLLIK